MSRSGYVGITITPEARDALKRLQGVVGAHVSPPRSLTLSEALLLAECVVSSNLDQVRQAQNALSARTAER